LRKDAGDARIGIARRSADRGFPEDVVAGENLVGPSPVSTTLKPSLRTRSERDERRWRGADDWAFGGALRRKDARDVAAWQAIAECGAEAATISCC
jgi:hypothetical protein